MKIVSFQMHGELRLGVETAGGVVDVRSAAEAAGVPAPRTARELIAGGEEALAQLTTLVASAPETVGPQDLRYAPPVPDPDKLICVGANYRKHSEEAGLPVPEQPIYFAKYRNSLVGHGATVVIPPVTRKVDYEVELVAVIGRPAHEVGVADALDHVFGYATGNDLSARELQMRTSQWMYGKALDGFAPLGPALVTADEVPDPQDLSLQLWVNGELRQDSTTKDMVFSVAELVSDLSQIMTLEPGDEVTCEVGGFGPLTTTLVRAED